MQTNMALIPYEENNSNDGRINPFCRAVYESVNDSGVRCYYEDEKMTKSAYIPAGTQLEYTCPGLLFGVKSEPPVPDIIPLFQSVQAKEFENRCKPFDLARYVAENVQLKHCNGRMYIWNKGCYHLMTEFDTENLIMQYCAEVIYRIGSPGIVKQVANALSLIPKIQCRDDEVNADLIPFRNGLLDISRMVFMPPQPDIFITHSLTVDFQQGNFNCPRFMGFLDTATGGDISLKMRILEIIGYLLSSHNDAKKFFVFVGVGDSGKSLLANLIVSFFTKESIFSAKMSDFGQRFTMGYMNGSQLCVFADMPNTLISANAVGNIKAITGGDTLFGERKNSSPELLRKTTRLLFSTNHEIRTAEPDKQFMDRCCIVPFMVSVPTEQQNPMLLSEMTMERSAIKTDSYIAVQLLEQQKTLDMKSISEMAELVEGSFVFTILDECNNMYFVKGDNPLALYHYEKYGFYVFASTDTILDRSLAKLGILGFEHTEIDTNCGDIIKIDSTGALERGLFDISNLYTFDYRFLRSSYWDYPDPSEHEPQDVKQLKDFAASIGINREDIDLLLCYGYFVEEIEEMLYQPGEFEQALAEILNECAYDYCGEF